MNEIALTDGNSFLEMAQQLDISLIEETQLDLYSMGSNNLTSYLKPKQIRQAYDVHKNDGQIKWTEIDYDGNLDNRVEELLHVVDPNGGDPRPLQGIVEFRGLVISYQQRDELSYYDGEKTKRLCSVIGYTKPDGSVVRDLPNSPYGMKYSFEQDRVTKKWGVNNNKPNRTVEILQPIGYRGERVTSCVECIKCGMSSEFIPDIGEDGQGKTISCTPKAKLYMAVYAISVMQRVKQKEGGVKGKAKVVSQLTTYSISDLVDFDGEKIGDYFFVEVPMSRTSIKGQYIKGTDGKKDEDKSADGYESYVRNLRNTYKNERDPLRNPLCHYTSLTFKANQFSTTFQAHFMSLGTADFEQFKQANTDWKTICPVRSVEELVVEDVQTFQADGTIKVVSEAVIDTTPAPVMKTVEPVTKPAVVTEVVEDEIDLDDIPF